LYIILCAQKQDRCTNRTGCICYSAISLSGVGRVTQAGHSQSTYGRTYLTWSAAVQPGPRNKHPTRDLT